MFSTARSTSPVSQVDSINDPKDTLTITRSTVATNTEPAVKMVPSPKKVARNASSSLIQREFIAQRNSETLKRLRKEGCSDGSLPKPQPDILYEVDWALASWHPIADELRKMPLEENIDTIKTTVITHLDMTLAQCDPAQPTVVIVGENHGDKASCAIELAVLARMRTEKPNGGTFFKENSPAMWNSEISQATRDYFINSLPEEVRQAEDTFSKFHYIPTGADQTMINQIAAELAHNTIVDSYAKNLHYSIVPFDTARTSDHGIFRDEREDAMRAHLKRDCLGGPGDISVVFIGTAHIQPIREHLLGQDVNVVTIAHVGADLDASIPETQRRIRYLLDNKEKVKLIRSDNPDIKDGNLNVFTYQANLGQEFGGLVKVAASYTGKDEKSGSGGSIRTHTSVNVRDMIEGDFPRKLKFSPECAKEFNALEGDDVENAWNSFEPTFVEILEHNEHKKLYFDPDTHLGLFGFPFAMQENDGSIMKCSARMVFHRKSPGNVVCQEVLLTKEGGKEILRIGKTPWK